MEAVGRQVQNLILVLNKADRTTDAEREAAVGFTQKVLGKRLKRSVGPVYELSAADQLENRRPERDWRKLLAALEHLVQGSGGQLIQEACDRGVQRLSEQLLAIITEEREALERPIEESERRIAVMRETIAEAEPPCANSSFSGWPSSVISLTCLSTGTKSSSIPFGLGRGGFQAGRAVHAAHPWGVISAGHHA